MSSKESELKPALVTCNFLVTGRWLLLSARNFQKEIESPAINSPRAFVTDASFDRSFDGPLPSAYQEKIPA